MSTTLLVIGLLIFFVVMGIDIALALAVTSIIGIFLVTNSVDITINLFASTAYESLREYIFAVVPLFILMGELISRSGAAHDLFDLVNRGLRRIPNRMSLAVVVGNALFAFVTGVSVAAAAAFTRIAYPEMVRLGYKRGPAVGLICGTACLGMLIPPSVLLIIWGVTTDQSVGSLFLGALGPGILIAGMFFLFNIGVGVLAPSYVFAAGSPELAKQSSSRNQEVIEPLGFGPIFGGLMLMTLVVVSLGGIWMGVFTPTEGAGIGAILALIIALVRGVRLPGLLEAVMGTARSSAPILALLIMAQFYSRMLALTGVVATTQDVLGGADADPIIILAIMVGIWFLLGMFVDSVSIILLTVPIFFPVAVSLGFDPLVFGIVGILAIEAGLLTPPFGMLPLAVKSSLNDDGVSLLQIYMYSIPYWIILLCGIAIIWNFPWIVNYLDTII